MKFPENPGQEHLYYLVSTISSHLLRIDDPVKKLEVYGSAMIFLACQAWNTRTSLVFDSLFGFPVVEDAALSIAEVLNDLIDHESSKDAFQVYLMVMIGTFLKGLTLADTICIYFWTLSRLIRMSIARRD